MIKSQLHIRRLHCVSLYVQLDQSPLGMPSRDYFLKGRDDKALKSYEHYVVNVAVAMGASRDRAEREIEQMVDFEILLANVRLRLTTSVCITCALGRRRPKIVSIHGSGLNCSASVLIYNTGQLSLLPSAEWETTSYEYQPKCSEALRREIKIDMTHSTCG